MSAISATFHASADGSPFGSTLCGFRPEMGESVWVTAIQSDVNCLLCLSEMGHVCGRDFDATCDGCATAVGDSGGEF